MSRHKSAEFLVFVASLLFGFTAIITKLLMNSLTPIEILMFRFSLAAVVYLVLLKIQIGNGVKELFSITKDEFRIYFFLSALLFSDIVLFFQALSRIDVSQSIFLFLTYPVFSLAIARIFINERATKKDLIMTFLGLTGLAITFWNKFYFNLNRLGGELMVIAASILWAGYLVLNRHSGGRFSYHRKTFWLFLLNSIMLLPIFIAYLNPPDFLGISMRNFLLLIFLSVVCTLIPYALLGYAAKNVKSSTSSVILLLGPIIGIIMSFVILNERPPLNVILGGLLILASALASSY